jgi:pilus assembly protein CpaF
MAMMSDLDMPLHALRIQLASAVNIIVQVGRLQDGSRKVTHISEVLGWDLPTETYVIKDIFVREHHGLGERGEILSDFVPSGYIPQCVEQLREHGMDLPPAVYEAAQRKSPRGHG